MSIKQINPINIIILLALALLIGLALMPNKVDNFLGNAGDIPATVATSSNPTVNTTAVTVFATSTCSSRTVTTVASPVMITFSDRTGQTPTATFGHLQAASTTINYDSSVYGCGLVKMYGFTSSAITVSESR